MKYFFIFAILLYQRIFSVFIKAILGSPALCRYSKTCSEYAKQSFLKYGILKGGQMSVIRLLSCQPWNLKTQMSKVKTTVQNLKVLRFTL